MVGKSARKDVNVLPWRSTAVVQSETDDEAVFDVVEQRVDALFEESPPAPDVPATPPRSPPRESRGLSPRIEKVVVEAEAMEREAQVKEARGEAQVGSRGVGHKSQGGREKRGVVLGAGHQAEAELGSNPRRRELERQLAARRERRRSLQAASPPTSPP